MKFYKHTLTPLLALCLLAGCMHSKKKYVTPHKTKTQSTRVNTPHTKINTKKSIQTEREIVPKKEPVNDTVVTHEMTLDKDAQIEQQKPRVITIINDIDDTMLSYKHWTGTYSPTKFHIFLNGKDITREQQITYTIGNNHIITFDYEYEFMHGYRKDKRSVHFIVDEKHNNINMTFSWHDKNHILCTNAAPIEEE